MGLLAGMASKKSRMVKIVQSQAWGNITLAAVHVFPKILLGLKHGP